VFTNNKLDKVKHTNKKVLDYCHELVLLNHLYECKLITKEEMLMIKTEINKNYRIGNSAI